MSYTDIKDCIWGADISFILKPPYTLRWYLFTPPPPYLSFPPCVLAFSPTVTRSAWENPVTRGQWPCVHTLCNSIISAPTSICSENTYILFRPLKPRIWFRIRIKWRWPWGSSKGVESAANWPIINNTYSISFSDLYVFFYLLNIIFLSSKIHNRWVAQHLGRSDGTSTDQNDWFYLLI